MTSLQFFLDHDIFWTTRAHLPSWQGFQSRRGPYGSKDTAIASDGVVDVVFAPEGRGNEPLNESEIASIEWAIANEAAMSRSLLASLIEQYPALQEQYDYPVEERSELMPTVATVQDFRELIGLHSLNVHKLQKDGIPYVGFELGCTWDDEHGLGVLMHGTRVVEIAGADTAILLWLAEADANRL